MTDEPNETTGGKPGAEADADEAKRGDPKSSAEPDESTPAAAKAESKEPTDAKPAATSESKPTDATADAATSESKPAEPSATKESKPAEPTAAKPGEVPHFVEPEDSYATDARRPTSDYRVIAIVLAIASVACLAYSAASRHWLYNPHTRITAGEYGFGPRGMFRCTSSGECEEMSNSDLNADFGAQIAEARHRAEYVPEGSNQELQTMLWREATDIADMLQTSPAFVPTAWIALVSIVVAAASLLVTLALALAGKRVLLPVQPTTTALLGLIVGLVAGCVFVATKPGAAGFVGVSYGFWVFGAGSVLGLAAATLLNKHIRPLDLDLLEDSMDPEQF